MADNPQQPQVFGKVIVGPYRPKTRAEELAELMKKKPPPGRRPIMPRVYEYYLDDEDLAGIEELDKFDAKGNLIGRKRTAVFGEGSQEDILQSLYSNKSRKQRIIEHKQKLKEYAKKDEERRLREAELQRQEDLKFASMMGLFYTDGYYDMYPPYGISPDILQEYIEKEAKFREKLQKQRGTPTFTDKFKMHFWPPSKVFRGKGCFRTRGSYIDFPGVKPGVIPAQVNLEHSGVEMVSKYQFE